MALRLAGRKYEVLLFAFVVVLLISGPLYIGRYVGSLGVGQAEELTLTVVGDGRGGPKGVRIRNGAVNNSFLCVCVFDV